ncbi:MAG: BamA/TamA family outer membrane protein, partial [Candidatus Marinimicrobia bacterium]|nr:BamA/TamA family outer membrane protein [Candidatus Neomarinimicrobiota bacterium]
NTVLSDGEVLELLNMRVGDPFRQYIYYSNINKILTRYSELGYPFASVREEYEWGRMLEITLYIQEGKTYTVDEIYVKGNHQVLESSIRKHIDFKKDETYRLNRINRTQDRIYEMGAFNSVNIMPVNADAETQQLDLEIKVVESKARRFDVEFGASQGYTEKIGYSSLFVKPQWIHKNMLHRAHRFSAGLKYEAVFHNLNLDHGVNANISYTVPWLIRFRLPTTLKLYYNRNIYSPFSDLKISEDDVLTDYGINLSSIWRYNRNIYARTSIALKNLKSELSGEGFEPLTEVLIQARFDNRDNFIYPSKGWNILLYSGYVLGTQEETETDYFRIETSLNTYIRLMRNLVAAGRFEIGQFFDRKTINPIYLYRMGSESTVRGWFQSIGDPYLTASGDTLYAGKSKVMANAELRMDLLWNFGVNLFIDAGRLDSDFREMLKVDKYYINSGFGIYYKTPIGPVRLELPILINNPNKGTELDIERSFFRRINFGLLFAF